MSHPDLPANPSARRVHDAPLVLSRPVAITGLAALVVAALIAILVLSAWTREHLLAQAAKDSARLASVFANSVWSEDARDAGLATRSLELMRGTGVVRLDVHLLDGFTLFSTDPSQVGKVGAAEGLRGAADGSASSSLTHLAPAGAPGGTSPARDLLSSYVPLRDSEGGQVKGVIVIHADATDMLVALDRAKQQIATVVMSLVMLIGALLFVLAPRRARRQPAALAAVSPA